MIIDMLELQNNFDNKNIIMIYSGPLWTEGVGETAGKLKKYFEQQNIPLNISQKVYSVFIEQMNNMLMYSEDKKGTIAFGVLNQPEKAFFVQSGNVMKDESIQLIKNRINHLNSLEKDAVRKFYKKQMHLNDDNPESKGSGLGLIEIARRSSSKIEYSFIPYNKGLAFFSIYVTIRGIGESNE